MNDTTTPTTTTSAASDPVGAMAASYAAAPAVTTAAAATDAQAGDPRSQTVADTAAKTDAVDNNQGRDAPKAILGDDKNSEAAGDAQKPAEKTDAETDKEQEGTSEDDKADDKDQADKSKEEISAETYQKSLALPEGMEIDQASLDKATPIFNKHGISPEALKDLSPVLADLVSRPIKAMADQHTALVQTWFDKTVDTHGKEGEAAYNQKVGVAQKAINKFFDADGRTTLMDYGFGSHPGLFAMAYEVGKAMKEDTVTLQGGDLSQKDETLADVWYPPKQS
jgi:hypothetical protein